MELLPGLEIVQNIHPLFVHFPIALILVTLLFEGIWWLTKNEQFRVFATYLLYLSALSAVTAVITGYIASNGLGHDAPGHDFVHEHRDVMLWMSGILILTALSVFSVRTFREGKSRRILLFVLFIISGILGYGADKGGRLVYEFGMGVKTISAQPEADRNNYEIGENEEADHHDQISQPEIKSEDSSHQDDHTH